MPALLAYAVIMDVIVRALFRIGKNRVRIYQLRKLLGVSALVIVGVIPSREMPQDALDGFPVGVWSDLQNFVIVGKRRVGHRLRYKFFSLTQQSLDTRNPRAQQSRPCE